MCKSLKHSQKYFKHILKTFNNNFRKSMKHFVYKLKVFFFKSDPMQTPNNKQLNP